MDGAEEVSSGFVVASCNAAVLLESCEEVLDQVASFVQMAVVFALNVARAARWNDDGFASLEQRVDHASLRVVGFVCQYCARWGCFEQDVSAVQIVSLSGRQVKPRRVAQSVNRGVYLGGQSSPAAPDGLLLRTPPFAPELCWWARTMVESIIAYSLSASCDRLVKMRFHTPDSLHREWRR